MGYRTLVSKDAERMLGLEDILRQAATQADGSLYLSVAQMVPADDSSGSIRDGWERLILIHPSLCDLPSASRDALRLHLEHRMKHQVPGLLTQQTDWGQARDRMTLHHPTLDIWLAEDSRLLTAPVTTDEGTSKRQPDITTRNASEHGSQTPLSSNVRLRNSRLTWAILIAVLIIAIAILSIPSLRGFRSIIPGISSTAHQYDFLPSGWDRPVDEVERHQFDDALNIAWIAFEALAKLEKPDGGVLYPSRKWLAFYNMPYPDVRNVTNAVDRFPQLINAVKQFAVAADADPDLRIISVQWAQLPAKEIIEEYHGHRESVERALNLRAENLGIGLKFLDSTYKLLNWKEGGTHDQ